MTTSAMRTLPVGVDAQLRPLLVPLEGRCRPPAAEDPEALAPGCPAVVILASPSALSGLAGGLPDGRSETLASGRDENWVENEEVGRKPAGLLGQVKVDHRQLLGTWPLLVRSEIAAQPGTTLDQPMFACLTPCYGYASSVCTTSTSTA